MVGTVLPAFPVGASVRVPLDSIEAYEKERLGRIPAASNDRLGSEFDA